MEVRPARLEDALRIEQIRVAGWHHAYADLLDPQWLAGFGVTPERVQRWADRIAEPTPGSVLLVAEVQSVVRGFATALPSRDEDCPGAFELAALYVDPAALRQGIGRALLDATMSDATRPQVLWVLEGNAGARLFYERFGFSWDGTRKLLDVPGEAPELRYRRDV